MVQASRLRRPLPGSGSSANPAPRKRARERTTASPLGSQSSGEEWVEDEQDDDNDDDDNDNEGDDDEEDDEEQVTPAKGKAAGKGKATPAKGKVTATPAKEKVTSAKKPTKAQAQNSALEYMMLQATSQLEASCGILCLLAKDTETDLPAVMMNTSISCLERILAVKTPDTLFGPAPLAPAPVPSPSTQASEAHRPRPRSAATSTIRSSSSPPVTTSPPASRSTRLLGTQGWMPPTVSASRATSGEAATYRPASSSRSGPSSEASR
ncbi:hypothetical protein A4X09_0g6020 [Tilletia walkeri]|uniref:Uncharacterized protein n=1 Tax=Tilletia walkeri TaxID=117179 RepID=A0A8X7N3G2_9BASI|nr:hypothetical protein A4X09_0g6020 [Tilletia walkeri]